MSETEQYSHDQPERDPLIGTMIGERYRLEDVLGSGGMGTVYLAEHVLMEKKVALKVLHPTLAVVSSVMERFQHEAVALSRIDHPNVVNATDFGKLPNGAYYLALQYVDGQNLAEVVAAQGALRPERATRIALQVARALEAAHAEGIVHRDLKPHNIMLTQVGEDAEQAKVLDFGLAKLRSKSGEGRAVAEGSVFGTPHYISPEQISGADVDGRADLYCLGLSLYEMLTGRRAFEGSDVKDVLRRQVNEVPPPLDASIPEPLRQLVEQLMQKDPDARPESATAVVLELQRMLAPPEPPRSSLVPPWFADTVDVAGHAIPRWAFALPLAAFVALFMVGSMLDDDAQPSLPAAATSAGLAAGGGAPLDAEPQPTIPVPDRLLALQSAAEFGDDKAIAELLAIPEDQRESEVWLVIGEGYMRTKRAEQALRLYQKAIAHKPALAEHEQIASNVRLAARDSATATLAVTVAAESLGQRGVNVLFSIWADTARRTKASALAERYLEQDKILQKASREVRLALDLRKDNDCQTTRRLLQSAFDYGDSRGLHPMAKLRAQKGCGPHKNDDCYPCLRGDTLLEDAIAAAAKRIAPKH